MYWLKCDITVLSMVRYSVIRGIKMAASVVCANCTLKVPYVVCRSCYKQYNIDAEQCPQCGEQNLHLCPRCWTTFKL